MFRRLLATGAALAAFGAVGLVGIATSPPAAAAPPANLPVVCLLQFQSSSGASGTCISTGVGIYQATLGADRRSPEIGCDQQRFSLWSLSLTDASGSSHYGVGWNSANLPLLLQPAGSPGPAIIGGLAGVSSYTGPTGALSLLSAGFLLTPNVDCAGHTTSGPAVLVFTP